MSTQPRRYDRIVFKVSGESLGSTGRPVDIQRIGDVARALMALNSVGVGLTVIVGGGNIFRGSDAAPFHLERSDADAAGMAATGVNALLLEGVLRTLRVPSRVLSRGPALGTGSHYRAEEARDALEHGQVVILAGGMGVSGFSTDVPAVHAAIDTDAQAIVMAKHGVDGVYDADPNSCPTAGFMRELTASEALDRRLRIMDGSALALAREHGKRIHVIAAANAWNVKYLIEGKELGSTINPE